jgi:hypothetical protein
MHKGTPSKIVTGLKNNSSAANGSTDHKSNQNEMIKDNVLATPQNWGNRYLNNCYEFIFHFNKKGNIEDECLYF